MTGDEVWRTPWGSNPARHALTMRRNHQMCLESVFVFCVSLQGYWVLLVLVASGAEGQIRTGAGRVRADRASATPPRRTKTGDEPGSACCCLAPGVRVERTFPVSETGGLPLADPGSMAHLWFPRHDSNVRRLGQSQESFLRRRGSVGAAGRGRTHNRPGKSRLLFHLSFGGVSWVGPTGVAPVSREVRARRVGC